MCPWGLPLSVSGEGVLYSELTSSMAFRANNSKNSVVDSVEILWSRFYRGRNDQLRTLKPQLHGCGSLSFFFSSQLCLPECHKLGEDGEPVGVALSCLWRKRVSPA